MGNPLILDAQCSGNPPVSTIHSIVGGCSYDIIVPCSSDMMCESQPSSGLGHRRINERYVANSAGVVHVAKREAEAEADADAYYGYYGYARPYAYGLGYRSYGYGYPYAYYGKRSADAEPEAKADAALLYGAYGYAGLPYAGYSAYGAYPYAYGAYPYAYGAYYGKRSADAEPEADAYYGYYGYARPYSYGYAPYAYGAYPYGYGYAWGK